MATSKKNMTLWSILSLFLTFILCVLLMQSDFAQQQTEKETRMIVNQLGESTALSIRDQADRWYEKTMIQTNAENSIINFFIPTEDERSRSRGLENAGNGLFKLTLNFLNGVFDTLYWAMKRVALYGIWLPLLIPLIVVAVFDGICERSIKKENFKTSSPLLHKVGASGIGIVLSLMLLLCFIPIACPPTIAPILMGIIAVLFGLSIGNFQKRI